MKTIPYKKKTTKANTQYNETLSTDTKWMIAHAKRLVEVAEACEQHGITEGSRLSSKNGNMPKQSSGKMNSPRTMCEGVIDNFNQGQYNITDKQIAGLNEAFNVGSEIIDDFEQVVFEEVETLPKVSIPSAPAPGSTFGDLFGNFFDNDVEEVHVTKIYRKKQ